MKPAWLLLIPAFIVFCCGSYCTFSKSFRDSSYYLPAFILLSFISGWLWVLSSRRLDSTSSILLFSLIWDLLMVVAYYAGPMLLKGESFGWQVYAAAAVTITGIIWFKSATGS